MAGRLVIHSRKNRATQRGGRIVSRKQDLHDRLQRAGSWIRAARELAPKQLHEHFIFLYIALNSLYGRRQYEGDKTDAGKDTRLFLDRLRILHEQDILTGGHILLDCLRTSQEEIKKLVLDYFLIDGLFRGVPPAKLKAAAERDLLKGVVALNRGEPWPLLESVLLRLTVLRNRVMHGCVTYGPSSKGLPSIAKGLAVIRRIVPTFNELMTRHGNHVKWDPIPYPRVGFDDPLETL